MSRRRIRTQSEWKVEISGLASDEWPSRRSTRSAISAGGLVGKCDGENRIGRDPFFLDQPGDAAGDDARLARAGAGQDQQRPFGGFNGGALFGIQIFDERRQGGSRREGFLLQFTCASNIVQGEAPDGSDRRRIDLYNPHYEKTNQTDSGAHDCGHYYRVRDLA